MGDWGYVGIRAVRKEKNAIRDMSKARGRG